MKGGRSILSIRHFRLFLRLKSKSETNLEKRVESYHNEIFYSDLSERRVAVVVVVVTLRKTCCRLLGPFLTKRMYRLSYGTLGYLATAGKGNSQFIFAVISLSSRKTLRIS